MPAGTGRTLRAGPLRARIAFLRPNRANDHGFASVTWVAAFTVWASARIGDGVNELTQDRRAAKMAVDFDVRYRADVTSDMRVVWRGRTFEITEPPAIEQELGRMSIRCLEESAP